MQEANPTAFLGETNKKGRWILRCGLGNEESLLTTFYLHTALPTPRHHRKGVDMRQTTSDRFY
jgi:hypothetical protein